MDKPTEIKEFPRANEITRISSTNGVVFGEWHNVWEWRGDGGKTETREN
jgi:hypothetical protein